MTEPETASPLTDRYTRAVDLARRLHADDVRKQTAIPYLSHLLSVSALVLEHGGTEDQAIAALLHDAAEDHGGQAMVDQIRGEFGGAVADIVAACSDSLVEDRELKAPWWDRKRAYLDRLAEEPADAALVSAADKLHNARSILADYREVGDELWGRFNAAAGIGGTLWYYRSLVEAFRTTLTDAAGRRLVDELARTVDAIAGEIGARGHDPDAEVAAATRDGV